MININVIIKRPLYEMEIEIDPKVSVRRIIGIILQWLQEDKISYEYYSGI